MITIFVVEGILDVPELPLDSVFETLFIFIVLPFQAFFRKRISKFWKFFYKLLHIGFYVVIYQTFSDEELWKEFADASGEVYEKVPAYDYISYFALLMIAITIISFFRRKSTKEESNEDFR